MPTSEPRIHIDQYRGDDLPPLQRPWWRHLPADLHRHRDRFAVDRETAWRVGGTAVADTLARTGLACLAGAAGLPGQANPILQRQERRQVRFYDRFLEREDPNEFFRPPEKAVRVHYRPVARYHFHPEDGEARSLHFESPFEPVNPALRKRYLNHRRNRVAWAQHWRHDGEPRPTLILIHGFAADPYWLNTRWLALPWFYKQGFDVLLYTLPFHGRRKGPLAPFSGAQFFSQGLAMLNETFAHAIHDLRLFMNYLRRLGSPAIGATGISLGGYTTALLAALEDDLAFAIPNVPLSSVIDLMAGWFPVNRNLRLMKRHLGEDMAGLRRLTALHSPLTWPARVPAHRRMIIGGAGDRFAPPHQVWLLWQHWRQCRLHWFPGNHLIHLDQGLYLKEMRAFMGQAVDLSR